MMNFRDELKKMRFKKKPRDGKKHDLSAPGRKTVLSAGAVLIAGGLLTAGILNANTGAYTSSFLSDNSSSRKITNENYDYKTADKHLIVKSASSLKESDGYKKIANGLYLVDKDKELDGSVTTYEDGDVVVADAEDDGVNPEEDVDTGDKTENTEISGETPDDNNTDVGDVKENDKTNEAAELTDNENNDESTADKDTEKEIVLKTDERESKTPTSVTESAYKESEKQLKEVEKINECSKLDKYLSTLTFDNDIKIAVVDSGATVDSDRVLNGANFSATGDRLSIADDNGHGSKVTELMLENTPDNVSILPVKVVDSTGHGTLLSLYQGIEYAIEQKMDIINISLASKAIDTGLIQKAVNDARNAGILVIAAAGNDNSDVKNYVPGNVNGVMTIAGIDENNNIAQYSNYGNTISYAANGVYKEYKGTSFAAARVSAVAAMIKSNNKNNDIESILDRYVYNPKIDKKYIGRGMITLSGKITANKEKELKENVQAKLDDWENISDKKVNDIIKDMPADEIAFFWQSLTEEKQKKLLERCAYLNQDVTISNKDGVQTKSFAEYLNSNFTFDDTATAGWEQQTMWDQSRGYFWCWVDYSGAKCWYKIDVSLSRTDSINGNMTFASSFYSGTNVATISCANGQTNGHNYAGGTTVTATPKTGYFIKNGGNYGSGAVSTWCNIGCLTNAGFTCSNNAYHNWKTRPWNSDSDINFVGAPGLHAEFDVGDAKNATCTVDVNPTLSGVAINGGSGRKDLTFDVYNGNDKIKNQVKDFCESVEYGSHLYIKGVSTPTGYHITGDNKGTYNLGVIKENKTGNKAICKPNIEPNTYDVAYEQNKPSDKMLDYYKPYGSTATTKGCTYGVTNYISSCGYTMPGYSFKNWNTASNGSGKAYNPGDSFTALTSTNGETVHLYAQWTKNSYTTHFDLNGGSGYAPDQTVAYGENVSLPMDGFSKEGKTFIGWSLTANDIGSTVQSLRSGFSYVNMYKTETKYFDSPQDVTLHAMYSIPVSDVKSVQLRVLQKNGSQMDVKSISDVSFHKDGEAFYSFGGAYRLVQMLNSSGGYYQAYDNYHCNLGADIIATDNAGNVGTIWKLGLNGADNPDPPAPEYRTVKTDHYMYKYKVTGNNGGFEYYNTTDGQQVLKGTNYKAGFLNEKSNPRIPDGYEPVRMTVKYQDVHGASESDIMNKYNGDNDVDNMPITENTFYSAYYMPKQYKVHFKTASNEFFIKNKNADNRNSKSYLYTDNKMPTMNIHYTEAFEELPSASKTGHTFTGWFVLDEDGNDTGVQIKKDEPFNYTRDVTVIPHWEINSYKITYDAATNGGVLSGKSSESVQYASKVNIDTNKYSAAKDGFKFLGWNTNPEATEVKGGVFEDGAKVLNNGRMPDKDITVYAIYSRTVTAKFYSAYSQGEPYEIAPSGTLTDIISVTYYNTDTSGEITAPKSKQGDLDWTFCGWSTENNWNSPIAIVADNKISISKDTDFYGLYQKNVTLSYESNCDASVDPMTGTVYFNAAPDGKQGDYKKNFEGNLDNSLQSNEANSFVGWVQTFPQTNCAVCGNPTKDSIIGTIDTSVNGCKCKCFYPNSGYKNKRQDGCTCCFMANDAFSIDRDTTVAARWDAYPTISAKDTYISVQEKNDFEKKLLDSAESIDNEDVTTPIVIQNKDEIKEIINGTDENVDVTVIYKTTDSYGNITTESKMLHVINTASKEAANTSYARFINTKAKNASYNMGGLEENSLWLTKQSYKDALNTALSNADSVKGKKMDTANSYLLGNGKAYKPQYVLKYTNSDIKAIKKYLKNNGYGKFQSSTDMDKGSSILKDYFKTYVEAYEE